MDEIFEEDEDQEEEIYFSGHDLLQIREAILLLLKNFLRLLPKFSLKEKPHCVQNCMQVTKTTKDSGTQTDPDHCPSHNITPLLSCRPLLS